MDAIVTLLLAAPVLYVAAGLLVGIAFVIYGVTAVQAAPVTLGARLLLLPGAIVLWPLILSRWFKARSQT